MLKLAAIWEQAENNKLTLSSLSAGIPFSGSAQFDAQASVVKSFYLKCNHHVSHMPCPSE